jgi:hypothetical protein
MVDRTESGEAQRSTGEADLATSGHVERTILHVMVGEGMDRFTPTTVSGVLDAVASVVDRGNYGNPGMRTNDTTAVRKSTIRRAFAQLEDKGLVQRVDDLDADSLSADRYDLGSLAPDGDAADPDDYERTTDDARVTDWIPTGAGVEEVRHLDERLGEKLDDLVAQYGRPRGETTDRIDT